VPDEVAELPGEHVDGTDGIAEADNPIPRWFNVSFLATIVFAIVYLAFYTLTGWSSRGQYEAEVAVATTRAETVRAALPAGNPYTGDAAAIAEGQQVFLQICAACHKPDGSGLVGPSLVDPYWKYGDTDAALFETVSEGRPGGMPAWKSQLGTEKIWKALAYMATLPRSNAPGVGAPGVAAATPGP
jgi:cytochrome c oxidase cbb3-type subunit 3